MVSRVLDPRIVLGFPDVVVLDGTLIISIQKCKITVEKLGILPIPSEQPESWGSDQA